MPESSCHDEAADSDAESGDLLPVIYSTLRRIAAEKLSREKPGHTLQPTALVHEAWLRLAGAHGAFACTGRTHFLNAAAEVMRRILVDCARRKQAVRHGGNLRQTEFDQLQIEAPAEDDRILAVHEALERLAALDREKADVVRLRFFGGYDIAETAEVLGISPRTAKRHWTFARAWLYGAIQPGERKDPPNRVALSDG
jgi:RNA polymerase sigma factor (TIGR02999 family)